MPRAHMASIGRPGESCTRNAGLPGCLIAHAPFSVEIFLLNCLHRATSPTSTLSRIGAMVGIVTPPQASTLPTNPDSGLLKSSSQPVRTWRSLCTVYQAMNISLCECSLPPPPPNIVEVIYDMNRYSCPYPFSSLLTNRDWRWLGEPSSCNHPRAMLAGSSRTRSHAAAAPLQASEPSCPL
ncbi:hypothetical protein CC78DRAFT_615363 [Lojkania enalia]|uniref:Uncharacterized protein n=1 Tax=Lojkania enalia TaxID=147567 RepID=A0A9P4N7A7_9PLEO|nr:hypothetical protein CC78DRAFT_615363 [Didymosphaeria enalia]